MVSGFKLGGRYRVNPLSTGLIFCLTLRRRAVTSRSELMERMLAELVRLWRRRPGRDVVLEDDDAEELRLRAQRVMACSTTAARAPKRPVMKDPYDDEVEGVDATDSGARRTLPR